jgi:hypothetical protein
MLLSNYSVQNRNCYRMSGNQFTNPLAHFKATAFPAFYCGDHLVADQTNKSAFPDGYTIDGTGGFAWQLAPKAGGISSRQILGDGDLTASGALGRAIESAITGTGDLAATGALIVSALAALSGSGTISGAALLAFLQIAANIGGTGAATALLNAIGHAAAASAGTGTIAGTTTATAKGTLAADITVTGATLSTANVGDAVWSAFCESGYTYQDVLRLISAVQLGKVSGGPGSPVFRDINDTTDRVTGTADSDGNRTAATYDPD